MESLAVDLPAGDETDRERVHLDTCVCFASPIVTGVRAVSIGRHAREHTLA